MKRPWLALVSVLVAASGAVVPVGAQAAVNAADPNPLVLETSPLPISLVADPGKSVSADLRVKQAGQETAKLKVSLMKFGAYGDTGKPEIVPRQPGDDYFDWVKFDKTLFDAPPNVWQTVHMTINLPKTAAFGYYYAVVFSRAGDDATPTSKNTNAVSGATAVLVLLEARNPNAKRTLVLDSFTSTHRVYEFLPAHFDVKLEDTGNVHGVPVGDVFISQGKTQLGALSLNAGGGNILPGSKRIFPVEWTNGFPVYQVVTQDGKVKLDKNSNPVRKLSWDWTQVTKLRIGRYTAHLFAVYDDGSHDVPLDAVLTFWVIPWRFLLVLLLVISVIGFGVYAVVRGTVRSAARGMSRLTKRRR